jgi:hypothetical protein
MTIKDLSTVQVVFAIGIVLITLYAAFMGQWNIVTATITGGFALLNSQLKGPQNEIPPVAPVDPPV